MSSFRNSATWNKSNAIHLETGVTNRVRVPNGTKIRENINNNSELIER